MMHRHITEALRILTLDYVLGCLPAGQAAVLTAHLKAGCKVCAGEVRANRRLIELLRTQQECGAPPPALRERLLWFLVRDVAEPSGLRQTTHVQSSSIPDGWTIIRKDQSDRMPAQDKAMTIKQLSHSQAEGHRIFQIRLQAQGLYPGFRCVGTAELYVVRGDLLVNHEWLGLGDYCMAPAGTVFRDMATRCGCEFILLRSDRGREIKEDACAGSSDVIVVRASDGEWLTTPVRGITVKPLFTDPVWATQTYLSRALPGSRMPRHRHLTADHTLFLEGDGHVGTMVFEAGDFYRAEAGTVHEVSWTERGCLCLTLASISDVAE